MTIIAKHTDSVGGDPFYKVPASLDFVTGDEPIFDARHGPLYRKDICCSNTGARSRVVRKEPFLGSNTGGWWLLPTIYVVWSYGRHWPLFVFAATEEKWYENTDNSSRTTSKHRGQLRPLTKTEPADVDTLLNTLRFLSRALSTTPCD